MEQIVTKSWPHEPLGKRSSLTNRKSARFSGLPSPRQSESTDNHSRQFRTLHSRLTSTQGHYWESHSSLWSLSFNFFYSYDEESDLTSAIPAKKIGQYTLGCLKLAQLCLKYKISKLRVLETSLVSDRLKVFSLPFSYAYPFNTASMIKLISLVLTC